MDTHSESLFHWKAPASQFGQRIILASLASLSIHILCFYIFQIQEPQARRTLPHNLEVTYLLPSDPNAHAMIQQIEDYHAGYAGTLLVGSTLEMPPPHLDYEPTYQNAKVQLMPLPDLEMATADATEVLRLPSMMLPAIPKWTPPEGTVVQAQEPSGRLPLAEGLELVLPELWQGRIQEQGGADWSAIKASFAADTGRSSWRMAIGPKGTVTQMFPLSETPNSTIGEALRSLTFSPQQGNQTTWLVVHLQW